MIKLTRYDLGNKMINTEYGRLPFIEWLKAEGRRLLKLKVKSEIRKSNHKYALYVDKPEHRKNDFGFY